MLFLFVTKQLPFFIHSASSARNKAAFAVIVDAVNNDHGGEEQCPWSPAQLRGMYIVCVYILLFENGSSFVWFGQKVPRH